MAWHSGKPADGDLLSASAQYIRENFAELEPLQPHVAELVDLTALQPHVAALLDSRIVEMGSNANGEYVRWENGLQVCFGEKMTTYVAGTTVYTLDPVPLPAAFLDVSSYKVSSTPKLISDSAIIARFVIATLHPINTTASGFRVHLQAQTDSLVHTEIGVQYVAIGRWK